MSWPGQEVGSSPASMGPPSGGIYTVPDPNRGTEQARDAARDARDAERVALERERLNLQAQNNNRGTIPQGMQINAQGVLEPIPGAPVARGRPMRESDARSLEDQVSQFNGLTSSLNSFDDAYGGNFAGDLENYTEGLGLMGSRGQRDWWANFRSNDNIIRNSLFGAALTDGERAAYNATTIEPSMDPAQIRTNLRRRQEIVRDALSRRINRLRAGGYNPLEIDAAVGEALPLIDRQQGERQQGQQGPLIPRTNGVGADPSAPTGGVTGQGEGPTIRRPPELQGLHQEIRQMLSSGVPTEQIQQHYAQRLADAGYPNANLTAPLRNIAEAAAQLRADPRKNLNDIFSGWDAFDTVVIPREEVSQLEYSLGQIADSNIGAAAISAGNAASAGALRAMDGEYANVLDAQRQERPISAFTGDVVGSTAAIAGLGKLGGLAAAGDTALARGVGTALTARAGLGADIAYGGARGFTEAPDGRRLEGALVGSAAGAAGNRLGQAINDSVVPTAQRYFSDRAAAAAARRQEAIDFARAADAEGITYLAADVPGATGSQMASGLINNTAGAIPLTRSAENAVESFRLARDARAAGQGVVRDAADLGDVVQDSSRKWIEGSQRRITDLYDAIPIPSDANAVLDNSRSALAQLNSRFGSNPEIQAMMRDSRLVGFEEALNNGQGLSWTDLKALRSRIGEMTEGALLSEASSRTDLRRLYAALSADMEATARAQGGRAYSAFKQANDAAAERFDTIETVLTPILGNDGRMTGEATFRRINAWAQERTADHQRLGRLMRTVPQDTSDSIRATIISRMGDAGDGAQNAAGDAFSVARFLTNWNQLDDKAKNILFTGEHRAALERLAVVSGGMKASTRFENYSRTGATVAAVGNLAHLMSDPVSGILSLIGQYGAGKAAGSEAAARYAVSGNPAHLLSNEAFTRWLAAAGRKPNPSALRAHVGRLRNLALAQPVIANDVLSLQTRLLDALAPERLAAGGTESGQDVNGSPRNVIPNGGEN